MQRPHGGIPGALSQPAATAGSGDECRQPARSPPPAGQAATATGAAAATESTAQAAAGQSLNESLRRTRNFEMDRTMSHTQAADRLHPAAVGRRAHRREARDGRGRHDHHSAAGAAELEEIQRLVRDAVGFDEKRGDTVSVSSMPFYEEPAVEEEPEEPGLLDNPALFDTARTVLAGLLVLAIAFAVIRPLMRALGSAGVAAVGGVLPSRRRPAVAHGRAARLSL